MSRVNRHKKKKNNVKLISFLGVILVFFAITYIVFMKFNILGTLANRNTSNINPSNNVNNKTALNNSTNNSNSQNSNSTKKSAVNDTANASGSKSNDNSTASNNSATNNNTTASDYTKTAETNDSKGNTVSVENAKDILKTKLSKSNVNTIINYDHLQPRDNEKYYVFRVSLSNSSQDNASEDIKWYYVNVASGKAYNYDIVEDKLNLL